MLCYCGQAIAPDPEGTPVAALIGAATVRERSSSSTESHGHGTNGYGLMAPATLSFFSMREM